MKVSHGECSRTEADFPLVIDYTKSDPKSVIPKGSVDFLFDTVGVAMDYLCLLRPKTGQVVSVATAPSGDYLQASSALRLPSKPIVPAPIRIFLNLLDWVRKMRASRWEVGYEYLFLDPSGKDLEALREWIDKGSVRSVVGTTVNFTDLEERLSLRFQATNCKGNCRSSGRGLDCVSVSGCVSVSTI
jgi:NADPH:quinone reductase-like Zn-dependent oxidoreductase